MKKAVGLAAKLGGANLASLAKPKQVEEEGPEIGLGDLEGGSEEFYSSDSDGTGEFFEGGKIDKVPIEVKDNYLRNMGIEKKGQFYY